MDNTSTMKRPSHTSVNNDKANGVTKETKVTNKNTSGSTFEIVPHNGEMPQAMNRAQRRAMAKRENKIQSKQKKRIMDYIKKHPEAVKIELDEEKIAEVEEQEQQSVGKRIEMDTVDEVCDLNHEDIKEALENNVIDVDFKEVKE